MTAEAPSVGVLRPAKGTCACHLRFSEYEFDSCGGCPELAPREL